MKEKNATIFRLIIGWINSLIIVIIGFGIRKSFLSLIYGSIGIVILLYCTMEILWFIIGDRKVKGIQS